MRYSFLLQVAISTVLLNASARADPPHGSKPRVLYEEETVYATEADGEIIVSNAYAKLRGFVWKHWLLRIPGQITLIGTTTEGDPYTATYRIQRNDDGVWRVLVQTRAAPNDAGEQRLSKYEACTVERVLFNNGGRSAQAVPDDAKLPPSRYRLLLKDRNNRVVVPSL